ncbi:probable protein phosphatase 2C 14 [Primulina eburnea]|uniref:probable protein phosphatase 2C 14 n=1 Tax=Primulina eburnea TaxID=1245227 RepID=UPI003C6C5441
MVPSTETSEVSMDAMNPCFSSSKERAKICGLNSDGLISCSLKRKRPPKIEIPNVLKEISTDIFKKCEAKEEGVGGDQGFCDYGVGVYSLKGKKKFMEDAHKILSSKDGIKKEFFGVYDGHGGSKAAEFVAENLHLRIFEMLENASESEAREEAIKDGYLKTDDEFLKQGFGSGACCVTALIQGQELLVSNLGDCRAVLSRNGIAQGLTTDHCPTREDEQRRIEDKGGYVEFHRGAWRVHGTLAVSRSIGDAHLKDWVISEPDTKIMHLKPDMDFLILASDGLWEEVTNQEAVDIVTKLCSASTKQVVRSAPEIRDSLCPCTSPIAVTRSPRVSLVKTKRMLHHTHQKNKTSPVYQKKVDDHGENRSPLSKIRRISSPQIKKNPFPHNENVDLVEKKPTCSALLTACKELVNLAVTRGSLDDITVMIVDLKCYQDVQSSAN